MTDPLVANDKQAWAALKTHGGNIVLVIVLVLGSFFGWQYYQKHYGKIDTDAADSYVAISEQAAAFSSPNAKPDESVKSALFAHIDQLATKHSKTAYAWQALMTKAHLQADDGDYKAAATSLEQALALDIDDPGLLAISRLQLATVKLADGDSDGAQALLDSDVNAWSESFEASRQELLGDILVAKNDNDKAKVAYNKAWDLLVLRQEPRALLSLKMQALGLVPAAIEPKFAIATDPAALLEASDSADLSSSAQ